jgi:hypothetical protein
LEFESTPFSKEGMAYLMVSSGVALFYEGHLVDMRNESGIVWVRRRPRAKQPRRPKGGGGGEKRGRSRRAPQPWRVGDPPYRDPRFNAAPRRIHFIEIEIPVGGTT